MADNKSASIEKLQNLFCCLDRLFDDVLNRKERMELLKAESKTIGEIIQSCEKLISIIKEKHPYLAEEIDRRLK